MLFFLLPSFSLAYSLTDCISTDSTFTASEVSQVGSVLDCENICLDRNYTYFLLRSYDCSCYNSTKTSWTSKNKADCDFKCQDGLPCGGRERFSLYEVVGKKSASLTVTVNPMEQDRKNSEQRLAHSAWIVATVVLVVGFIGFMFYLWYRNSKRKQLFARYYTNQESSGDQFTSPTNQVNSSTGDQFAPPTNQDNSSS